MIDLARQREASAVASSFAQPRTLISVAAIIFDWVLLVAAVLIAVVASALLVKLAAAIVAGTAISMLFILGHDAAHRSLVANRTLNEILGRVLFLPCLHNYTLWVVQHNRLHHQSANVKGLNSFSPLSPEEYSNATAGRRLIERIYRSPVGFGLYYLIERWWRDKFFPRPGTRSWRRYQAWADLAVLCIWMGLLTWGLIEVGLRTEGASPITALFWGFVLPFLVWNQLMGMTAFLQHTHPNVAWFRARGEEYGMYSPAEHTVLVNFPAWYDVLSHNIMQHQAHHINARIPWFRLKVAQRRLSELTGPDVTVARMSVKYLLYLTRNCQLYDYESGVWLRFSGRPSSARVAHASASI